MSSGECLTKEELHLFLTVELPSAGREVTEAHLSHCHACRQLLLHLYEQEQPELVIHPAPPTLKTRALALPNRTTARRRRIFGLRPQWAGALAAVIVTIMCLTAFLLIRERGAPLPADDVLRQQAPTVAAPRLLNPEAGAQIGGTAIEFRWTAVEGVTTYRFFLLSDTGDIVWQAATTEARVRIRSDEVRWEERKPYFWYVNAKAADGMTADSEMRRFVYRLR